MTPRVAQRATRGQPWPELELVVNCQELLEQLGDYLDEEARQELCREIEEHLERCHDCRLVVDQTRKTIVLYQADQPVEMKGLMAATSRLNDALAQAYREGSERPSD
jgi:predicted anti-sigma-YlaC factor YlaD